MGARLGTFLAAVGLMAGVAGCQHAASPARDEGSSAVRFVERAVPLEAASPAAHVTQEQPERMDVLVPAEALEPLAKPVFPRAALGRQKTPVFVGVRLAIDRSGCVTDVGPSLATISTPGPFADEFRAAVEAAVPQWRFKPAELRTLKAGKQPPGGKPYWVVTRAEPAEYTCDVSITFTDGAVALVGVGQPKDAAR